VSQHCGAVEDFMPARFSLFAELLGRLIQNGTVPVDGFLWSERGDSQRSVNERAPASGHQQERPPVADFDARQLHGFPRNGANFR
jgi:hypothetical protein